MLAQHDNIVASQRKSEIALRIKEARSKARLTQEQAAMLIGCSLARYHRVERADAELTLMEAEMLAKGFGVPMTYFMRQLAEYA